MTKEFDSLERRYGEISSKVEKLDNEEIQIQEKKKHYNSKLKKSQKALEKVVLSFYSQLISNILNLRIPLKFQKVRLGLVITKVIF